MKKSASVIQNAYRSHLRKKFYLSRLWKDYRKNIYLQEKSKLKDLQRLGLKSIKPPNLKTYPETTGLTTQLYPNELLYKYSSAASKKQQGQLKANWQINETIPFNDKNTFQVYIADYDLMGTQYYQGKWLTKYAQAK